MGEIIKCIEVWLLMDNVLTSSDKTFWFGNKSELSEWGGSPFILYKYMSGERF